jgi:hypothetical protein
MEKIYSSRLKKSAAPFFVKKGINVLFLLAILLISKAGIGQTYCAAAATSTADDEIFNVTFGTLNNTSTCSSLGGPGSVLSMYNNYTALPAPVLTLGANYPLSVTIGMCGTFGYSGRVGVWIDYNQNGLFTDPGENIIMSPYTAFAITGTALSAPGGITIPMTATPGTTRMRVIETESSTAPGPCTNPTWGEVEDYNVTIIAPSPLDLGMSAFVKPLSSKICYATDTIVATLKNYGSATADFSINQTTLTVNTTGPNASTYTLALTSGTLATNATQNFTLSTNYNLANIGTYKLKAFATVVGDGSALNDTTTLTITRSPIFGKSVLPNDSVCLGVPVQLNTTYSALKQVGVGTIQNSSTSYPAPFGNFYEGAKHQFLFLASELTAAGITAGNINSMAFDATNLNGTDPLVNYNVAIATTTLTNITAFQTTGFTTYFSAASYVPVVGTNSHVFSTPFVWDGVSNIIIETCFNNTPGGFTSNVSVSQSTTPFTSTVWRNADGVPALCSQTTISSSMSQRPNISFEQPATITYSWSPAIELSATNIANPIANVTSTRTYTVEGTVGGCMTYDTVQIFVKPTPIPNLGNDSLFCNLPVNLFANTTASSYLWSNNTIGSSINVTTPGSYWVRATNANGCVGSDTVLVTLGSSPIVTLGADTAFCQGKTINLYAGSGSGNTYLWSTSSTASSITVGVVGTYSVVVTNSIGCITSDIINVSSKANPTVSLVFTGTYTYCASENVTRALVEGVPANGTYIGAGVTNASFNPSTAGQGNHIILYNIVGSNGCSNVAKDTIKVSACVSVEELSANIGFNVYPNPNTGLFTIELNSSSDIDGKLTIMSIDGKLVYNDIISGNGLITKAINISDLSDGIYYLKLETKDAIKTYKVLKQ